MLKLKLTIKAGALGTIEEILELQEGDRIRVYYDEECDYPYAEIFRPIDQMDAEVLADDITEIVVLATDKPNRN